MIKEVKVVFQPSGRSVHALPGTIILEAAALAGIIIATPCGGSGKCGKCVVRVVSGNCPPSDPETSVLGNTRIADGFRLACMARITGPLTIEIPDSSLFQAHQQILTTDTGDKLEVRPRVRKSVVHISSSGSREHLSDLELLREAGVSAPLTLAALRALPVALRASDGCVSVVQVDDDIIALEPGDTTASLYGIAFDIGSTTLVGTLVNLMTGADVAVAARVNPQTSFGDDVVSRIQKCRTGKNGLAELQTSVLEGVNRIIDELERTARISRQSVYEVVFAGNTTMQQILCGIDPSALGELPFAPAFRDPLEFSASEMSLHVHPCAKVYVFPQIGGFVGGDTTAGIVATRLDQVKEPTLLVDIGTNGEIVLKHGDQMLATSVAAGPAFEGARITNGMRATSGAIEKVIIDGDAGINVIGNTKPAGLCGTGLIDIVAELLRVGILDETGRILSPDECPAGLAPELLARLVGGKGETNFLLVPKKDSATGEPILLYQRDIRELQLANAAIRAGINILLRMAGVDASELGAILLAGGFGNFIRRNHARRIGMLPPIPCDKIRFVGNTSSFGAKRVLLSTQEKDYTARVVKQVKHIDLSLDPEFQLEFSTAMLFPNEG